MQRKPKNRTTMRFTNKKVYSATVYDKESRYVFNAFNLPFKSKTEVIEWAELIAERHQTTFGHVSVCDDETSQIVRYTPSGKIWG